MITYTSGYKLPYPYPLSWDDITALRDEQITNVPLQRTQGQAAIVQM